MGSMIKFVLFLVVVNLVPLISSGKKTSFFFDSDQSTPPLANGLGWDFYKSSCPTVESIVRNELKKALEKDIGLAAALLRIHFHDCFVQGCDASVLLDGSMSGPGEQQAPPNLTLRPAAIALINSVRARVHKKCGRVVSCSDLAALLARDSVVLSGGPNYRVPLGRRDGLTFATREATLAFLPAPTSNVSTLVAALAKLNLDVYDLVALSGGHTIGIGHCTSFQERLYPQDPIMEKTFASNLKRTCPALNVDNTTVLDLRSPYVFDNKYYVNLMNRQGLFTSDQDLYTDKRTKQLVVDYAVNQELFFHEFAYSVVKMGQLGVLTGSQGEIRANCSARNVGSEFSEDLVMSVVDNGAGDVSF